MGNGYEGTPDRWEGRVVKHLSEIPKDPAEPRADQVLIFPGQRRVRRDARLNRRLIVPLLNYGVIWGKAGGVKGIEVGRISVGVAGGFGGLSETMSLVQAVVCGWGVVGNVDAHQARRVEIFRERGVG